MRVAEIGLGIEHGIRIDGEGTYFINLYAEWPYKSCIGQIHLPDYTDTIFYQYYPDECVRILYDANKYAPELTKHRRALKSLIKEYVAKIFMTRAKYNLD